jgi:4a-hydroxytetrahydrobiopterin dehydratase
VSKLSKAECVPCRSGDPSLADGEIKELQVQVPEWNVIEIEGIKRLERSFKFKDYVGAMGFTTQVAMIAQAEDHHPRLVTEWGNVTVQWWTHTVKGLHMNDFIMAARTDELSR